MVISSRESEFRNMKIRMLFLSSHSKVLLPICLLAFILLETSPSMAQSPCTNDTAYETGGKWARQKKDDLAMADPSFSKEKYKSVLEKAQKVIDLLMAANPEFAGIQAYAYRSIRGRSLTPNGALPFQVDAVYDSYICVGMDSYKVEKRGTVLLNGVTNWTTIYFNSFGHALESLSSGPPFVTAGGDEIFIFPSAVGEINGIPLLHPTASGNQKAEAVIIAPVGRLPFKILTREDFLRASISFYQSQSGNNAEKVASLNNMLARMSPAVRQEPAIIRNGAWPASPASARPFVTEAEGGRRLVTVDKGFFDAKLSRDTIQFITVVWSWDDTNRSKSEMIRAFKRNFDFPALAQMLGK